ncbi:hypothetical protein C8F04DRAFT_1117712, partial [Mycena alexandri]
MVRFDDAQTKVSLASLLLLPLAALSTHAIGLFSHLSHFTFVLGAWSSLTRHTNLLCLQTTYSSPLNKLLKPIQTRRLLHCYDYFKPSNVLNVLKYRGPQRSPSILPSSIHHQVHSSQDPHLGIKRSKSAAGKTKILPQVPRSSRFKPCRDPSPQLLTLGTSRTKTEL